MASKQYFASGPCKFGEHMPRIPTYLIKEEVQLPVTAQVVKQSHGTRTCDFLAKTLPEGE